MSNLTLQAGNIAKIGQEQGQTSAAKSKAMQLQGAQSEAEINKVAEEFEAVFIAQMLQSMFDTVPKDEVTGGGYGEDVFQELLVDEYGKILAETGGIGIADDIKRQLLQMQEVQ